MKSQALTITVLSLSLGAAVACAQETKTEAAKPKDDVVQVSGPTSHVSASVSQALHATLPKYTPPPPPPLPTEHKVQASKDPAMDEAGEEEAEPESKPIDSDQPKNKIIRLPKYVVTTEKPPIFTERDINTKSALAKLAVNRYLSKFDSKVLNGFTIPIFGQSAEARAMAMYEEEERLKNMSDLKDAARGATLSGDKAESEFLKKESESTYLRHFDMGPLPKE